MDTEKGDCTCPEQKVGDRREGNERRKVGVGGQNKTLGWEKLKRKLIPKADDLLHKNTSYRSFLRNQEAVCY